MNVYGLDIPFQQGLEMLGRLLKTDARVVELVYLLRAEQQSMSAEELLQMELEYFDPQVILSLATKKELPLRSKCFQIERKEQKLRL